MEEPRAQHVEFHVIRNVPETLNATFDFLRQHTRPLGKLLMQRAFPPLILGYIIYANLLSMGLINIINPYFYGTEGFVIAGSPLLQALLMIVLMAVGYTLLIAGIHSYALRVEEYPGEEVDLQEVWQDMKNDFWMVLGTNIGIGIISLIAAMLIGLVSGVVSVISPLLGSLIQLFLYLVLYTNYSLYYPARLLGRNGFGESLSRSSSLVSNNWWKTMGLLVLLLLLLLSLSLVAMVPVYILLWLIEENSYDMSWMEDMMPVIQIVVALATALFASLLQIFAVIPFFGLIFHYYNQIERSDGWGLEQDIEQIGVVDVEV